MPTSSATGITVVIPAYNYERYLAEAVDSALAQDHDGPVEVLVVDDGSTDRTPDICASYGGRIRHHRKTNAGLSAARNSGMELASHDWVLFLDADDVLEPCCVRRLCEVRATHTPTPVVVGSLNLMIDEEGRPLQGPVEQSSAGAKVLRMRDFVLRNRFSPVVLADRRTLLSLGGFDTSLRASEDRDMWIRVAAQGEVLRVEERLYRKRDHGNNMSRQAERQTDCILQVLEKAARDTNGQLAHIDLKLARAVCFYQSARMHQAAGATTRALQQCLRSWAEILWIRRPAEADLPALFRIKFMILSLLRYFKNKKPLPIPLQ